MTKRKTDQEDFSCKELDENPNSKILKINEKDDIEEIIHLMENAQLVPQGDLRERILWINKIYPSASSTQAYESPQGKNCIKTNSENNKNYYKV
ncbi:MAG: hypothetical protein ACK4OM_05435 [Alphaproteobacteria bacterium]